MKTSQHVPVWIFAACLIAWEAAAQWSAVGTGIDYQKFTTTHPNNVFVTRMAVANTDAIIGSMIASNRISGAREIVSSQAARYEDAINYWGESWGQRNDVVVGINGSFFNTSGVITGGHIYDGWYSKRFDDWGGQLGFVWKMDRSYFNGVCLHFLPGEQTVSTGGASRAFDGINVARAANQLIVYTPQYNNNTLTSSSGVEVLVEMPAPLALLNPPAAATGAIRQVRIGQGSTSIPFDHIVLSGEGTAATFLQTYCQVGQQVSISQRLMLYDGPSGNLCSNPDPRSLHKTYALAQGNFEFLKNGVTQPTSDPGLTARNPRTAVAYNSTYIFFVVCDGRSSASVGMSSTELASFCRDVLGATYGVNMDGGGSSVMWVNGEVKNVPSDGSQRAVANGLMMLNVKPKISSSVLGAGDTVTTRGAANMRLGPGTDYHSFTTLSAGATGAVLSHSLNGVYAKGYYWWKCAFASSTGWVAESLLQTSDREPSLNQQPANRSVRPGGTAQFSVSASGSMPLYYTWEKDAVPLADTGHYSGSSTPALTVSGVDQNDTGNYRCIVTNTFGSVTSNPAMLILVTNIFAAPLTNIPPLPGDTANEARAVTSDGAWAVGVSGSRGFLFGINSGSIANVAGSDAVQSLLATGVSNRKVGSQQEIVVSGLSSSGHTVWKTANGGTTWSTSVQTPGDFPSIPAANGSTGTGSDVFYSAWTYEGPNANDNWTLYVGRFSNAWPATAAWGYKGAQKPDTLGLNAVSANGRAVGWRRTTAGLVHANYVADWQGATTPKVWFFNGLNPSTNLGQAFSVSANGRVVFGISPKVGSGTTNFAYRCVFSDTFPGPATQLSIAALPAFPDTGGSTTLAVPYGCTPDGYYAVGMNYRNRERAVLWDTHDPNPNNWTVTDLTDLAAGEGNLDIFSSLSRAYSVGTNATGHLIIAGVGWDTNNVPNRRAFLMEFDALKVFAVPQPTLNISGSYASGFTFSFVTVSRPNVTYHLECTTNLSAPFWTTIASVPANGDMANLPDNSPSPAARYYRLRVQ